MQNLIGIQGKERSLWIAVAKGEPHREGSF